MRFSDIIKCMWFTASFAALITINMAACSDKTDDEPDFDAGDGKPEIVINEKLLGKWRCKSNVVLSSGNYYTQTLEWVDLFFDENGDCCFKYEIKYAYKGVNQEPSVVEKESKVYKYSASYNVIKIFDDEGFYTEVEYYYNVNDYEITLNPIGDYEFFPIRKNISANLSKEDLESFVYTQYGVERIDSKLVGRWHCQLNIGTNGGNTYSEGISWLDVEFDKYGGCRYFWEMSFSWHPSEFTWDGESEWKETTTYTVYESGEYNYTTIDGILKVRDEEDFYTQVEYIISGDTLTLTQYRTPNIIYAIFPQTKDLNHGFFTMPSTLQYIKLE